MKHFLEISQVSRHEIETLLSRSFEFKTQANIPSYPQYTVANLFYENSTRTRVSLSWQPITYRCQ